MGVQGDLDSSVKYAAFCISKVLFPHLRNHFHWPISPLQRTCDLVLTNQNTTLPWACDSSQPIRNNESQFWFFFFFCWNHLEFLGFYWIGWRPQGSRSLLPPRERGSYLKTTSIERKSTDERREEMESWEHFLIPPSLTPAALLNFLPSFPG